MVLQLHPKVVIALMRKMSDTTVMDCDILNVEEVEILNSATVAITAGEKISIKSGFRAAADTNVKISLAP